MAEVLIGIHVYEGPSRLRATLESLRADIAAGARVLLLGDGPDAAASRSLASLAGLPQSNTAEALGAPACFNRLVASSEAGVYVFLEGGAVVGRGWLARILEALAADERNGLAGPSTNHCWNEQSVGFGGGGDAREVEEAARAAAARFGSLARTLGPLHSLADFCYAVRREVVEAVGAADEGYGCGPCWEMDYNVRAERAGFRGVWACGAYVWRPPFAARRRREEALLFDANKRRYQDKFCGARLRGEKTDYRQHCRGDACPNFAPPALIEVRRERERETAVNAELVAELVAEFVAEVAPAVATASADEAAPASEAALVPEAAPAPEASQAPGTPASVSAAAPLVTCIMPTCDRRAYVPQAIKYFLRQDYPNLELLVVDDGADAIADCLPEDARIRYVRVSEKMSIGAKRNFACARAEGEFIAHWDDDDWYTPRRISLQVEALLGSRAEACGTSVLLFYDASAGRAWEYRYTGRPAWVAGSSLLYRKSFWAGRNFPEVRVGEDTRFVWGAPAGALLDLSDEGLCVALIHEANTGRKETGGSYWRPESAERVHALLGEDLAFYVATTAAKTAPRPLVSCIMPTYNRRPFVPLALESFRRQDYPNRELIVVDDGEDAVADLCEGVEGVRYLRLRRRTSIGGKRNLACREARGELIAHWDDDDWYAPERLRRQVEPILAGETDLTGIVGSLVMELPECRFWTVLPGLHASMFVGDVHGGTLAFRKSLLGRGVRYPEVNLAEDAALLRQAVGLGMRLARLPNENLFVYVRHGRNAWGEFAPGSFLDPSGWRRIDPPHELPAEVLRAYRLAAEHFQTATHPRLARERAGVGGRRS